MKTLKTVDDVSFCRHEGPTCVLCKLVAAIVLVAANDADTSVDMVFHDSKGEWFSAFVDREDKDRFEKILNEHWYELFRVNCDTACEAGFGIQVEEAGKI